MDVELVRGWGQADVNVLVSLYEDVDGERYGATVAAEAIQDTLAKHLNFRWEAIQAAAVEAADLFILTADLRKEIDAVLAAAIPFELEHSITKALVEVQKLWRG